MVLFIMSNSLGIKNEARIHLKLLLFGQPFKSQVISLEEGDGNKDRTPKTSGPWWRHVVIIYSPLVMSNLSLNFWSTKMCVRNQYWLLDVDFLIRQKSAISAARRMWESRKIDGWTVNAMDGRDEMMMSRDTCCDGYHHLKAKREDAIPNLSS